MTASRWPFPVHAGIAAAMLAAGFAWGVAAERFGWFPHAQAKALLALLTPAADPLRIGQRDTVGRAKVDCASLAGGTLALLLFGQSNAANSGDVRYPVAPRSVYNYNLADDRCYAAQDPLLGATGSGGAIGTRLGARIVESGLAARVLLVPIAVAGSTIAQWAPPGELSGRAPHAVGRLAVLGIPIAAALWQQGESEGTTSAEDYASRFRHIAAALRSAGFDGRLIVSHSTRCGDTVNPRVRAANEALTAPPAAVEMGPDFDRLAGTEYRSDGCHLNERGQQVASADWLAALARAPLAAVR